ncbi:hypothetical protein GO285_05262 [Ralstonia solanacearum]|nr:hypothetical protein [Ralstonia solanacearum]NKG13429.1 hypothetical protein [Ralstonia solanacearum]
MLIEADTPKPLVPYEIPTLADDELFSLRVLSVSWLATRLTALAAPSTTSFAETPLPAMVRLPVPATGLPLASLAPVAISVALPPAISVLPWLRVASSVEVLLLWLVPHESVTETSSIGFLPPRAFPASYRLRPIAMPLSTEARASLASAASCICDEAACISPAAPPDKPSVNPLLLVMCVSS